MSFRGADTEQLVSTAGAIEAAVEDARRLISSVSVEAAGLTWQGDDYVNFMQQVRALGTSESTLFLAGLSDLAARLRRNAAAQDAVSAALGGSALDGLLGGLGLGGLLGGGGMPGTPNSWFIPSDTGSLDLNPLLGLADGLGTVRDLQEVLEVGLPVARTVFQNGGDFRDAMTVGLDFAADGAAGFRPAGLDGWGAVGIGLDLVDVGLNWQEHGWGDARTLEAIVDGVGGTVAGYVAGPVGSLAWEGAMMTGDFIGDQLNEHLDVSGHALSFVYGDPESMTVAEVTEMNERLAQPHLAAWDLGRAGIGAAADLAGSAIDTAGDVAGSFVDGMGDALGGIGSSIGGLFR